MGHRPNSKRLIINTHWLGMPLVAEGGFDSLRKPIGLSGHAHPGYEITYLEKGEVTWQLATGESLHVCGGKMAITQPGLIHQGEWEIIRPCTLYWIIYCPANPGSHLNSPFNKDLLAQIDGRLANAGNKVVAADGEIVSLFRNLHRSLLSQGRTDPLQRAEMQSLASLILVKTTQSFTNTETSGDVPQAHASRLLDKQLEEKIPISSLAQRAGMSVKSFRAILKKETGQSPADYLARARCAKAREFLAHSNETITAIAFGCGFESSQYFATCFRKYTGMSPGEFRKEAKRKFS